MKKYRISWRSQVTGKEGHGKPIFDSFEDADEVVMRLNNRYTGVISHWVEPVDLDERLRSMNHEQA